MVDLSEIPPKRYIVSPETGYKLESGTVDYRPDRESQKHKKGLEKEYAQNNEALTKIEGQQQGLQARKEGVEQADLTTDTVNDQLYRLYINDNQIKGLIERVDTARESGQDTQELESQLRAALIHKIDGEITSLLQQQQELQQRNTEIEEQIAVIDSKEAQRLQAYQEQLRLKDIQARKTRDFLSSIGFDLIPQSTTDQVIATLNSNTGLRAQLGITGEINLAE
ncbi:MAG: hypothetical protein H6767_09605 [Candidatus Peribacteria bacterium]|nr:MAG: hypothetical protein H6767_09605 [Candidatus Peribacteria bacterium]